MSFFDQRLEGKTVSWQKSIAIHWPVISVRNVEFVVIRKLFFQLLFSKTFLLLFLFCEKQLSNTIKMNNLKPLRRRSVSAKSQTKAQTDPGSRLRYLVTQNAKNAIQKKQERNVVVVFNELYLSWHLIWLCYIWCQQSLKTELKPTVHYNAVPHFYHRGHQFPNAYVQCSLNITNNKGIVPCCTSHCGGVVTFLALSSASETNWWQNPKRKKNYKKEKKKQEKELLP